MRQWYELEGRYESGETYEMEGGWEMGESHETG